MLKRTDTHTLTRKTFTISRLADFATISELTKQTGQPVENWRLVVVKELADNALDDAEKAGVAPEIEIVVTENSITVADHGSGIAPATVKTLVDYSFRMSSNAAYVSPTRGQQGNALQILFAMPYALNGKEGEVLIESRGVKHAIRFTTDPVRQTPVVSRAASLSTVKNGTRVTVRWPNSPRSNTADAEPGFLSLAEHYGWFNPRLNLNMSLPADDEPTSWKATDPNWSKWRPNQPTSAHWYDAERLKLLMTAEIAHAEDNRKPCPTVRDFIGQFRGLSGTAKQNAICKEIGVAERETLADFYARSPNSVGELLTAMRAQSRPVKPLDLGLIGESHLLERLVEYGCASESFVYRKAAIEHDGLPYVIEAAFGWRPDAEETDYGRQVIEGFNFSPTIGGSPFRLSELLEHARVEDDDPVTVFAHLTSPRLNFLDRGKSRVSLPVLVFDRLFSLVKDVTKAWTKQKLAEIRHDDAALRRRDALVKREKPMRQTEAAASVITLAYMFASANGTLPANPRQIFYAARPDILRLTGLQKIDSKYFTQTLLPDFMNANPTETADWNIAWDDRGHFTEPHTGRMIGLGTLAVRHYIQSQHEAKIEPVGVSAAKVATRGPKGRFAGVLYIEKEGFTAILEAARIAERFDLAIASSKGMSVTACRMLVEELCGRQGLPLFILHDFDKAGFSIKQTLFNSNRRYTFEHEIEAIDLGLRLTDIEDFARAGKPLQAEPVHITIKRKKKVEVADDDDSDDGFDDGEESLEAARENLRKNGALPAEIDFLLTPMEGETTGGKRVELNSMVSDVFIAFVERKLIEHGLRKVVPSPEMLAETYAAFKRGALSKAALETELARPKAAIIDVPANLDRRVRAYLDEHRDETWDDAVRAVMEDEQ